MLNLKLQIYSENNWDNNIVWENYSSCHRINKIVICVEEYVVGDLVKYFALENQITIPLKP